jgi:hypothetical protein
MILYEVNNKKCYMQKLADVKIKRWIDDDGVPRVIIFVTYLKEGNGSKLMKMFQGTEEELTKMGIKFNKNHNIFRQSLFKLINNLSARLAY